jgi:alpha-D-xyloside xylohydrolase
VAIVMVLAIGAAPRAVAARATQVAPGVWRIRLGAPDKQTPVSFSPMKPVTAAMKDLGAPDRSPLDAGAIRWRRTDRGVTLELPLGDADQVYGFGLHLITFNQTGSTAAMLVNENQGYEDGSSHAPAPFYVTTGGYGVLVDTLRPATFHAGNTERAKDPHASERPKEIAVTTGDLYRARAVSTKRMMVDIPAAKGVDVYVFAGPTPLKAVQRYNLFSGGGAVPPLWGLGVYYRGYGRFAEPEALNLARYLRENHIPCDVFGLEPGWQSAAYSCSFKWSPERWPTPDAFIAAMKGMGFEVNLWEHAFTHPTAPFHDAIAPYSGDYTVWNGLTPDFTLPEARRIFQEYHGRELVDKGISSFKLDECDAQPHQQRPWSFPDFAQFPGGLDGARMHNLFGLAYQRTIGELFTQRNRRTWGKVRSSGALAAPSPFVLYSDYYEHRAYVRGILNAGFCGLLWQPELREASSLDDLYRRTQTAVFSPQTVIDCWFMPQPSWFQIDREKNIRNEVMPEKDQAERAMRDILNLRMSLVPYLYSAFSDYGRTGKPPFRALVLDWPDDKKTWNIDDEYMMGDDILAAPLFGHEASRSVYLPKGDWYCFWTGRRYEGGVSYDISMPAERIPLFVRGGALLPLAEPVEHITPDTVFQLTVRAYGSPCRDRVLFEDDGFTNDYARGLQAKLTLSWSPEKGGSVARTGNYPKPRNAVKAWMPISGEAVPPTAAGG